MNERTRRYAYVSVRMIELLSLAAFILGFMWEGAETLMLSTPQFLMVYGGLGAVISEIAARGLKSSGESEEEASVDDEMQKNVAVEEPQEESEEGEEGTDEQ